MTDDAPCWDPYLGPMPDMTLLPMDWIQGDEQFAYDDGTIVAGMSVSDGTATIHDLVVKNNSLAGARSGAGRRTMETMRPHFERIVAGGVGDPYLQDEETGRKIPIDEQKAFLFWRSMLREGLIDEIDIMFTGSRLTREGLGEPFDTGLGQTIEPDPQDLPASAPGF